MRIRKKVIAGNLCNGWRSSISATSPAPNSPSRGSTPSRLDSFCPCWGGGPYTTTPDCNPGDSKLRRRAPWSGGPSDISREKNHSEFIPIAPLWGGGYRRRLVNAPVRPPLTKPAGKGTQVNVGSNALLLESRSQEANIFGDCRREAECPGPTGAMWGR